MKTISKSKNAIKTGTICETYDTGLIFSRVMGLQATSRNVDFKDVLSYELAAIPTSLFENSGDMRLCTSKADIKANTQVVVSERSRMKIDCLVLDGCAILWIIQWPSSTAPKRAQIKDNVDSFKSYILQKLEETDVYLVFDRYIDFSTEKFHSSSKRCKRVQDLSVVLQQSSANSESGLEYSAKQKAVNTDNR